MVANNENFNNSSPHYDNVCLLNDTQEKLSLLPPLVQSSEINKLNNDLTKVFRKQAFIIQLGDCAERFFEAEQIVTYLKHKQLSFIQLLVENKIGNQVILIGRIAGQYAKPRSISTEIISGKTVCPYYGDMINSESADESRKPDPLRMLQAYNSSKKVLSHIHMCDGQIFTSHECFLLQYEQPLTRNAQGKMYNLSTHLPWLGMRNMQSEAHLSYLETISNPIALKIGPQTSIVAIISAIKRINPHNKPGKISLILRLGKLNVNDVLPNLIKAVVKEELNVIWMNDPLHGNTKKDSYEKKYRLVGDAIEETLQVCNILQHYGIHLGGLHLEATYKSDVQECVYSVDELIEHRIYNSALDPRLNNKQCIYYLEQVLDSIKSSYGDSHQPLDLREDANYA